MEGPVNNEILNRLETLITENDRLISALTDSARQVCDNYWTVWNGRNKVISQETYSSGGKFKPGRYAPVIAKVGSAKKITVVWKDFSPRYRGQRNQHGTLVKSKLGGYSVSCFKHALDWEIALVLQTEEKFSPIRELLLEMHSRRLRDIKKLEKLKRSL
jgi:hypothetical protein